jgi:hypothetical protein
LYCNIPDESNARYGEPLRPEFPGTIYHPTSRGNARQKVFLVMPIAFRLALPRLLT